MRVDHRLFVTLRMRLVQTHQKLVEGRATLIEGPSRPEVVLLRFRHGDLLNLGEWIAVVLFRLV